MKSSNITVLRKILYAVESGGQVYGKQRYDAFAGVGANTPNEKAITIGAGQWYAEEARTLLKKILSTYPDVFRKNDDANIESDLSKSWATYGVTEGSKKGQAIIRIISTSSGIKCQDSLMNTQIKYYASSIESKYGEMTDDAMMECINIIHQGGSAALSRILGKTSKPYSAKKIYDTLCLDPKDKTNNNQVGDYVTRQQKVYSFIVKYCDFGNEETTITTTKIDPITSLFNVARNEVGYLEKATNSNLDSKTGNAGSNNYTKYWRDVYPQYQAQPWCACFVSWCFMKAFGLDTAKKLLKHWPYVYCPTLGELFTKNANPKVGDIVIFKYGSEFGHTGIVTKVEGDKFWTIEGNTSNGSAVIPNGGGVCEKSYYNSNLPGTKFCTPDYSIVTKVNNVETKTETTTTNSSAPSKTPKWVGKVTATTLNVRSWAGVEYPNILSYPILAKDNLIDVCDTVSAKDGSKWYYIRIAHSYYGFVSSEYIVKA